MFLDFLLGWPFGGFCLILGVLAASEFGGLF